MKHNWGLEFQEREEKPSDYLRAVMVTNQSGEPRKFLTGWKALGSAFLQLLSFLLSLSLSVSVCLSLSLSLSLCVSLFRVQVWRWWSAHWNSLKVP